MSPRPFPLVVALLLAGGVGSSATDFLGIRSVGPREFALTWSLPRGVSVLEESLRIGPGALWTRVPGVPEFSGAITGVHLSAGAETRFYRIVELASNPARIVQTSPTDGEVDVSVHRETVFRFDAPLASDTVLDASTVSARAAGTPLLTRPELATDRRSVALFYLEPIPANTRVQVRFDGFRVLDDAGRALDADADGQPGGVRQTSFTTINATAVGATAVVGRVLASDKNADGSDRPLRGVTITVDGAEQDLRTTTAADGTFRLQPAPTGRFFVHIDGRTSPLSRWPEGAYYPFVGKSWEAEPGRTNNLAGDDGVIYLPLVPADALQTVSATDTTVVSFSPSILAATPALEGVEVRIPANALFSDNGTRGGRVGIAPVAPDRLPESLPPGLELPLVITIQTDGPSNFDRPVPVRFPNLPDPVTGEALPAGAKTALWSFDHDTGRWEIAGPMTISADGRFAETDPGVGVRQPGWHGAGPGGPGGGPGGPGGGGPGDDCPTCDDDPPQEPPDCNFFDPFCEGNNCRKEARLLANSVEDLILDIGAAHMKDGAPGCAAGIAGSAARAARDCSLDLEPCGDIGISNPIIDGAVGAALGCIPKVGAILGAGWTFKSVIFNVDAVIECAGKQGQRAALHGAVGGGGTAFATLAARLQSLLQKQIEVCEASSNLVATWFGPAWAIAQSPQETDLYASFFQSVAETVRPDSDGRRAVTAAERATLLGLPRPSSTSSADVESLVDRLNVMATGSFRAGTPAADAFLAAQAHFDSVVADRIEEGWETLWDGIFRVAAVVSSLAEPAAGSAAYGAWTRTTAGAHQHAVPSAESTHPEPAFPKRSHFFHLQDLATGFLRQGRLTPDGQLPPQILAPNRRYRISYLDPETGRLGSALFRSVRAGFRTRIPAAPLLEDAGPDRDGDGLADRLEWILGSDPERPDSDGDGVSDGAEFRTGDNPADGREQVIGVVGGADTPGSAEHLDVEGDVAVVADGNSGVAVFDLSDPRSPVRIAQVALPQVRSVALRGGIALVGRGNGASLLDLRLPSQPAVVTNFAGTLVPSVALASPFGYFARGSGIVVVDLASARLLPAVDLGAPVHDLAVDGDILYAVTVDDLRLFRRVGAALNELSRTPVEGRVAPLELGRKVFAGGGRAYVGYFEGFTLLDVSNPTAPVVRARQPQNQAAMHDLVENGSGLLAATTSFSGTSTLAFSLYDVLAGDATTNFVANLPTPGDPRAVVVHRGLAYVADGPRGLQVLNFLPRDTAGQRPSIAFGPPLASEPFSLEIGSTPLLTFATADDRQVREVELHRDGIRIASAGSFPFQIPLPIAPAAPGQTTVVYRARAIDTAGNERWTDDRRVTLTPDRTPPEIQLLSPANGGEYLPGTVASITVGFSEAMAIESLSGGLYLSEAGPDGSHATDDDRALPIAIAYREANRTAELRPNPSFPTGRYRLRATPQITDASGLPLASERVWTFRIPPPAVLATTPANNSNHRPGTLTQITARFSVLMDTASLRSGGFRLDHAGPDGQIGTADDVPVDVSALDVSSVSNRMTFVPTPPLRSGRYRATLTTNALDILGNAIASPTPWTFSVLYPSVTSVEPPDGHARPVNGLSTIEVRFSEPMNPASLATGLTLALTNGTPVSGGRSTYDETSQSAVLRFDAPLPAGEYRFQVTPQATDRFGNPVNPAFGSRFGVHGPVSWAVDADGAWNTASNWTPHRPGLADDVIIDRPAGVFTVSHTTGQTLVNTLQAAENLRLTGGSLTLRSNASITGSVLLQNSILSNPAHLRITGPVTFGPNATVRGGGTLTLAGPASLQGGITANAIGIGGQTVVVEGGPLTWTAGNLNTDDTSVPTLWIVAPGATLSAVSGSTSRDWQSFGSSIWNRGTLRQSGTTNRLRWIGLGVTNDGLWEITAGQADVQGSLVQSGRLAIADGSSLRLSGNSGTLLLAEGGVIEGAGSFGAFRKETHIAGRFTLSGGATFESLTATITGTLDPGPGALAFVNCDVVFDNGPLTLQGPVTLREGLLDFLHPTTLRDLRWNFGDLRALSDLTVTLPLRIGDPIVGNGARFLGPGRLRALAGLELGRTFRVESNGVVEHSGVSVWKPQVSSQSNGLDLDPGTVFRNLADGELELGTNRTVNGQGTFENLGKLRKAANPLTNLLHVVLENTGTLDVAGGRLVLSAGGTLGGSVHLATGSTLEITGANRLPGWRLSGVFTGEGTLAIQGASNHLAGSLAGPRLLVAGPSSLRLPPDVALTNSEIRGGTLWLDGNLALAGTQSVLAGRNTRVNGSATLRNEGVLTESATWLDTDVENAGTWNYLTSFPPRYTRTFRNLPGATYTVTNITSVPSGEPEPGTFDNAGLVRKLGPGNAFLPFAFTNRGVLEITGALAFRRPFVQTESGITRLDGGRLTPAADGHVIGGEIRGTGSVGRESGGSFEFQVASRLRPGGPDAYGTLTLDASSARLLITNRVDLRLGGTTPGVDHDQLRGSRVLWLDGTLRLEFVPGFAPAIGTKFLVVAAPSRNRTFRSNFEVVGLPADRGVRLNYLPDGVEAEIIVRP